MKIQFKEALKILRIKKIDGLTPKEIKEIGWTNVKIMNMAWECLKLELDIHEQRINKGEEK